ncbi:hypothetical protein [Nocardia heshunensis]
MDTNGGIPIGSPTAPTLHGGGYQQFPTPQPPQSRSRGYLWPLTAVFATSTIWAGALFGIHMMNKPASSAYLATKPDIRGYHVVDDLCKATNLSPVEAAGFKVSASPVSPPAAFVQRHSAMDAAKCEMTYEKGNLATVFVTTTAVVHKESNPLPAFRQELDIAKTESGGSSDEFQEVTGLGDAAYVSYDNFGSKAMTVTVLDGWFVYSVAWTPLSNVSTGQADASMADKRRILTAIATTSMPMLRK